MTKFKITWAASCSTSRSQAARNGAWGKMIAQERMRRGGLVAVSVVPVVETVERIAGGRAIMHGVFVNLGARFIVREGRRDLS